MPHSVQSVVWVSARVCVPSDHKEAYFSDFVLL